jgi:hypothetical protein
MVPCTPADMCSSLSMQHTHKQAVRPLQSGTFYMQLDKQALTNLLQVDGRRPGAAANTQAHAAPGAAEQQRRGKATQRWRCHLRGRSLRHGVFALQRHVRLHSQRTL